jgi:hypothetical protein
MSTSKIIVPAGVKVRQISRTTRKEAEFLLPESVTLTPKDKFSVSLTQKHLRTILSFQYKGRRATVKLNKCQRLPSV